VTGASTPLNLEADEGVGDLPAPSDAAEFSGKYQSAVMQARAMIAAAAKDEGGRIKDDDVRWSLADLMLALWPRVARTKEEASEIQRKLARFANDVGYKLSMLKDFYYVAEQWPPDQRVPGKSFAQHSKLRGRGDKAWALLGLAPPGEDREVLEGLTKSQIRKVEKVLEAIDGLDDSSSAALDAVVSRLRPKARSKGRAIISALRMREKEARQKAEAMRKVRSHAAIVFDYQSHLLGASARAQGLAELIEELKTQEEKDYVRSVIEGTVFVNQSALEAVLDALDEPPRPYAEAIEASGERQRARRALVS